MPFRPIRVLGVAVATAAVLAFSACGRDARRPSDGNTLLLRGKTRVPGVVSIPIRPFADFGFMSRSDFLALRTKAVLAEPGLAAPSYAPGEPFAQVVGGKPWWGLDGLDHYWVGKKSIEGLSLASRFVLNPYLLVGLREPYALCNVLSAGESSPRLLPDALEWNAAYAEATARYHARPYFDFLSRFPGYDRELDLAAYNAKDFGYHYIWVDRERSKNVEWLSKTGDPGVIPQFIHCGNSCGYPGGCNNMSPTPHSVMAVKITGLPATIRVKLWKKRPDFSAETADMTFVLRLD
jgi:hypothetical protein